MTLIRFFFIIVLLIAGTAYAQSASAQSQTFDFKIYRGSGEIGTHVVKVVEEGNRTTTEVDINLKVKVAFITLYTYEHRATEIREDGKLISLSSKTDDNGTKYWTEAIREGDEIKSKSNEGEFTLPGHVIPTTYWSYQTASQSEFLDSQTGQLWQLQIEKMGVENVTTLGGEIKATRYQMSGDQNLDIWYTDEGNWVKLAFDYLGSTFEYKLQSPPS